jgi:uncharacterized protein DUF2637
VQLPQLKRIRWAVRAALFLGVAASVAANVLHAQPNPISRTISAWPPLALLLTVELTSRVPMHRAVLAALRVLATVAIAGIAAWVSYWHMQLVAVHYGETETSSFLLPISVDGLIVVASVSLVELAGRIRAVEEGRIRRAPASPVAQPVAPVQFVPPAPVPAAPAAAPVFQPAQQAREAGLPAREEAPLAAAAAARRDQAVLAGSHLSAAERASLDRALAGLRDETDGDAPVSPAVAPVHPMGVALGQPGPAVAAVSRPEPAYAGGATPVRPAVARPAAAAAVTRTVVTSPTNRPAESTTPRQRRPVQETAELAAEIEAMHPEITETELARRLGISPTRLRAVRREAREVRRMTESRR